MGLLIDTSIIVQIEREDKSLDAFITSLQGEEAGIAAITASELLVGIHRGSPESRRRRRKLFTEYVLESFPVLAFDVAVARTHARIWSELAATGNMIGLHDLMIAATAMANDLSVLTYNSREFAKVAGLDVRSQV